MLEERIRAYQESGTLVESEQVLTIHLDSAVLFKLYSVNRDRYQAWWRDFSRDYFSEVGLRLPELVILPDGSAEPATYTIKSSGVVVEEGGIELAERSAQRYWNLTDDYYSSALDEWRQAANRLS